jgi:hypothetical protein
MAAFLDHLYELMARSRAVETTTEMDRQPVELGSIPSK